MGRWKPTLVCRLVLDVKCAIARAGLAKEALTDQEAKRAGAGSRRSRAWDFCSPCVVYIQADFLCCLHSGRFGFTHRNARRLPTLYAAATLTACTSKAPHSTTPTRPPLLFLPLARTQRAAAARCAPVPPRNRRLVVRRRRDALGALGGAP